MAKALPTSIDELKALGKTQLEIFLASYTPIFDKSVCETINFLLSGDELNKYKWRTHLQDNYGISPRNANRVISAAKDAVDSGASGRILHIKTLEGKPKSCTY
ncbi:hypothetical protein QUA54_21330 [Microcoleus sp. MOSTC5]|uniref:hypothetical protein n=1 Tax=Microcoleus sp. MOSTC5 TaxID=3055378 RepID=UPI002FCFA46E